MTQNAGSARTYRQVSGAVLGLAAAFLVMPWALQGAEGRVPDVLLACRFRALTGRPCPTCGLTRGMRAMFQQGSLEAGAAWNRLAPVFTALAVLEVLYRTAVVVGGRWWTVNRKGIVVDAAVHLLLFAAVMVYLALSFAGTIAPSHRVAGATVA